MAFPTIAATNTGEEVSDVTSHVFNLPASISSGDLLIVVAGFDGAPGTITWPAGWTLLWEVDHASTSSGSCYFRRADGDEGATITVTCANVEASAHCSYRITGHHATTDPEAGTAEGTTANPDCPDLNPAGWGTEDTLWIASYCWDGGRTNDGFPTNHTLSQIWENSQVAGGSGAAMSGRNLNAANENPGTGTISSSDQWTAGTIAVRTAGVAGANPKGPLGMPLHGPFGGPIA